MTENERIITHPGGAHFDEVTAIALILAVRKNTEFTVERREPEQSELEDPAIWVIDVGDRFEPEKRNFDHHQSLDCPASFILVADHLGLTETMSVLPWWHFKDEVDRFGPRNASIKYNAGDELVNDNPVEKWLTAEFVSAPHNAVPMLKKYGQFLINEARLVKKQIDIWNNGRRVMIEGVPAVICETRDSAGLEEYRRLADDPADIVISLDRRDDGWRLFRFEGTPVDFSRLIGKPGIAFAHKTGFLAKTDGKLAIEEVLQLVSGAVVKQS